jgi:hypothetical protein
VPDTSGVLLDVLWFRTWWSYAGADDRFHATIYRGLNLVEAVVWFVFAALVAWRAMRHHRLAGLELVYALLFLTFGLTDVREAWALQSWLIWLKLANLIALIGVRRLVMRRHYSLAKLY